MRILLNLNSNDDDLVRREPPAQAAALVPKHPGLQQAPLLPELNLVNNQEDLNLNVEENQPEAEQPQSSSDKDKEMTGVKRKKPFQNPTKKKGKKLPYPKSGQEIFFRLNNWMKYSKTHPTLVT